MNAVTQAERVRGAESPSNAAEISRCVSEINPFGRPHVNGSDYNNYTPSPF